MEGETTTLENILVVFKKLHLSYDLVIPFPVIYPRERKSHIHANETGWDLGPGTRRYSACTWTNVSSSNKIQRNYKGLKYKCMQLGQIMNNKVQKDQKHNCHCWGARSRNRVLRIHPAHSTIKRVGKPPKEPLQHDPWIHPTLTPYKAPAHPCSGRDQGHLLLVFTLSCCSTSPS